WRGPEGRDHQAHVLAIHESPRAHVPVPRPESRRDLEIHGRPRLRWHLHSQIDLLAALALRTGLGAVLCQLRAPVHRAAPLAAILGKERDGHPCSLVHESNPRLSSRTRIAAGLTRNSCASRRQDRSPDGRSHKTRQAASGISSSAAKRLASASSSGCPAWSASKEAPLTSW